MNLRQHFVRFVVSSDVRSKHLLECLVFSESTTVKLRPWAQSQVTRNNPIVSQRLGVEVYRKPENRRRATMSLNLPWLKAVKLIRSAHLAMHQTNTNAALK
jgi:hypothetical protein